MCQRALLGWSRPKLGFQAREVEGAVRVERVEAESPASRAGLRKGDLILSVGGRKVQSTTQLRLGMTGAGPYRLSVRRGADELSLEVSP